MSNVKHPKDIEYYVCYFTLKVLINQSEIVTNNVEYGADYIRYKFSVHCKVLGENEICVC